MKALIGLGLFLTAVSLTVPASRVEAKTGHSCTSSPAGVLKPHVDGTDLVIQQGLDCQVKAGTYKFRNVHILDGGILRFTDANIDFWAANILVEKGGSLLAGVTKDGNDEKITPIANGVVTIHLYGKDQTCENAECAGPKQGTGIKCFADPASCGVPPGGSVHAYQPLPRDDADPQGYFGYKVLAVSYGGTLRLFGKKGATYGATGECSEAAPTT